MVEVFGDKVSLALDCGPGWTLPDAIRFARAVEHLNLLWLEDMLTGDYVPYVNAEVYRDLTQATSTPIHTGEQIYLRQNFVDLIEKRAVDVVGPDPMDVGGIGELKWITEFADLHGVDMAPHGTLDGIIGIAALTQVSATLPQNYLPFEMPNGNPEWWYDIVEGPAADKNMITPTSREIRSRAWANRATAIAAALARMAAAPAVIATSSERASPDTFSLPSPIDQARNRIAICKDAASVRNPRLEPAAAAAPARRSGPAYFALACWLRVMSAAR